LCCCVRDRAAFDASVATACERMIDQLGAILPVVDGLELDQLALEGTYPAESGPLVIGPLSRPWIGTATRPTSVCKTPPTVCGSYLPLPLMRS
jgi:hypothetical protein